MRAQRLSEILGLLLIIMFVIPVSAVPASSPALPLSQVSFQGLDGSTVTLSDFHASVVLLNFWGTWCVPCLQEIPELIRLSEQFSSSSFRVVGVAVESGSVEDIRAFLVAHHMNYPIVVGDLNQIKHHFQVMGFPTSLLMDRHGMVYKRYFGPQMFEVFQVDVETLLEREESHVD